MGFGAINIDLGSMFGSAERIVDELNTSKEEKLQLANELLKIKNETIKLQNEAKQIDADLEKAKLELEAARLKVDEAMQKSDNKYASSARPTIIYAMLGVLMVSTTLLPISAWIAQCVEAGHVLDPPQLNIESLVTFAVTALGISWMRGQEKKQGIA